jgi:hypothetical protein
VEKAILARRIRQNKETNRCFIRKRAENSILSYIMTATIQKIL